MQDQGGGEALSPDQMKSFQQLAVQVNDGISQVGQLLERIEPDAAGQMADLQKGYQQIITAALQGGGKAQPQERPADQGGAPTRQAY